jgi:chromosome segregation ATPase
MNTEQLQQALLSGDVDRIMAMERAAEASKMRERAERAAALASEAEEVKAELVELNPQQKEARARVLEATDAIREATKRRELLAREAGVLDTRARLARERLRAIEAEQAELLAEIRHEAAVWQAPVVHDMRFRR